MYLGTSPECMWYVRIPHTFRSHRSSAEGVRYPDASNLAGFFARAASVFNHPAISPNPGCTF